MKKRFCALGIAVIFTTIVALFTASALAVKAETKVTIHKELELSVTVPEKAPDISGIDFQMATPPFQVGEGIYVVLVGWNEYVTIQMGIFLLDSPHIVIMDVSYGDRGPITGTKPIEEYLDPSVIAGKGPSDKLEFMGFFQDPGFKVIMDKFVDGLTGEKPPSGTIPI